MSGSKDRGVQFWDPATGNAQMMLQGHKNSGEHSLLFFPFFFFFFFLVLGKRRRRGVSPDGIRLSTCRFDLPNMID
jgi:hypothetical protein